VSTPAATASGLNYTANLYVFALRPRDINNAAAGYYKASFVYPFSFRLQQTVTDLSSTSSKWAFAVRGSSFLPACLLVLACTLHWSPLTLTMRPTSS
jgi:hypothetical protein